MSFSPNLLHYIMRSSSAKIYDCCLYIYIYIYILYIFWRTLATAVDVNEHGLRILLCPGMRTLHCFGKHYFETIQHLSFAYIFVWVRKLDLTASQRWRTEAAEMKLLRPLAGHTVNDHKTNDSIGRELQTECILDKIDEYRRNWLLHLQRMPQHRIPLKSYRYSPQGKRAVGRPKKRWREQL
jgi:hypothetical protein